MVITPGYTYSLLGWSTFLTVLLGLCGIYALLRLMRRRLERGLYLREADGTIRALLRLSLLSFAPIATVVVAVTFVAVHPLLFGPGMVLIVALAWRYIRDFFAGRILRFDRSINFGRNIATQEFSATIAGFGLTGLYLQREDGRSRVPYSEVLEHGYSVAGDPTRGGYFHLQVELPDVEREADTRRGRSSDRELGRLRDHLLDSPYVKRNFTIERNTSPSVQPQEGHTFVDVGLGVHRAIHLRHLVEQLGEAGYAVSVEIQ